MSAESHSSDRRSSSSNSSKSTLPPRTNYGESSFLHKQKGCDCANCREHEDYSTTYIDKRTGDKISEAGGDSSSMKVRVHEPPASGNLSRRSTSDKKKSSSSDKSNKTKNVVTYTDRHGNTVKEYNGSTSPEVTTHYDWDANQKKFPGEH